MEKEASNPGMSLTTYQIEQLIAETVKCASKAVPKLAPYKSLTIKLDSLSDIFKECFEAKPENGKMYAVFETDIKNTCERIKATCHKYATAKFRSFCKHNVVKELEQHSQHIAHTINTMAIYSYMRTTTCSRKNSDSETASLQSVVTDLRFKVESLNRQLTDLQQSHRGKSTAQRKNSCIDFDFDESKQNLGEVCEGYKKRRQSQIVVGQSSMTETYETLCVKGDRAYYGHGTEQNYQKALEYYKEASEKGSGKACACIGRMYENGIGTDKDLAIAFSYYKLGAEYGEAACLFALGKYHEKKLVPESESTRGLEDAVIYYESALKGNFPEALTKIGYMYEQGIYYERDLEKAFEYYKKASKLGDALAMNYVGLRFYKEQKYKNAVEMFKKSKDLGCARGANNLGLCYEQGLGVEQDLDQAVRCYKESADKKYPQAMFNLGYLYLRKAKSTESIEEFEEAVYWLRAAISEDPSMSEPHFYLGFLFEKGLGVNYDLKAALEYYDKAYKLGFMEAGTNLAMVYLNENCECYNEERGIEIMREVAEKGDERAKEFLQGIAPNDKGKSVLGESDINVSKVSVGKGKKTPNSKMMGIENEYMDENMEMAEAIHI